MFTFDQFAALIKAGYTQNQIMELNKIMEPNTPVPAPAPAVAEPSPAPAPVPNPAPATPDLTPADATPAAPQQAAATTPGTAPAAESETVTLLKEMLGIIQKGNINTIGVMNQPKPEDGAEILATILGGPTTQKGK